jgi:hypothetical protein
LRALAVTAFFSSVSLSTSDADSEDASSFITSSASSLTTAFFFSFVALAGFGDWDLDLGLDLGLGDLLFLAGGLLGASSFFGDFGGDWGASSSSSSIFTRVRLALFVTGASSSSSSTLVSTSAAFASLPFFGDRGRFFESFHDESIVAEQREATKHLTLFWI